MPRLATPTSPRLRALLVLLAGAIGYGVSAYPVLLLGGVLLSLGQIASLIAALAFGPVAGLVAGVLSAGRYLGWHQEFTFVVLTAEAVTVGILSRRTRPLIADALFWLALGVPAMLINYALLRSMAAPTVTLIVLKNVIGGLFNVTIASIVLGRPITASIEGAATTRGSLVAKLNSRLAAVLAVPVLVLVVVISTISQRNAEAAAYQHLELESRRYAAAVDEYVRSHVRTVATVAAAVAADAVGPISTQQRFLEATRRSNPGFLTMMVADSAGVVRVAASGTTGGLPPVAAIPSVKDRAYFTEPMRTGRAFVSGVFRGRAFGSDLIYAVSAPIPSRGNRPAGIAEGSLSVAELRSVIGTPTDVHVTLIDDQRRVIFSTVADRWPVLSELPATIPLTGTRTGRFVTDDRRLLTVRREQLYALARTERRWIALVEGPRYDALSQAAVNGTLLFVAAITLFVALLFAVRVVNAFVARPLADLEAQAAALDWSAPAPTLGAAAHDTGPREVAVVGEALQRAAARIAESYREAQHAVAARDVALAEREMTLRDLDATVRRRTRELEVERDRAEAASRAKSAFLANMSHELRTPLNVILGQGESIVDGIYGPVTDRQAVALAEMEGQGQHLLALINEILDLARIESGKFAVELKPVLLPPLLEEVASSFRESARQRGLLLSLETPTIADPIAADALRLRQVLINLVGNALKFTPAGGRVTVTLELAEDERRPLAIRVRDTGLGIPADRVGRIFDAFEQVDNGDTRSHGGSGLGLTISRSLCDAMGMRIAVESRPGSGSTFTLYFADTA